MCISRFLFIAVSLSAAAAQAKPAPVVPEAGSANLSVAVEGKSVLLGLLANVADVKPDAVQLKAAELFGLPKELQCTMDVSFPYTQPPGGVVADFVFKCHASPQGAKLQVTLLKAFPQVKKVTVKVTSGATHKAAMLTTDGEAVQL